MKFIQDENFNKLLEETPINLFTIGQQDTFNDEEDRCKQARCIKCKSDEFAVGIGSHYTAIACIKCGWQVCVHDG